jgi:predicted Fe-S protein YdhL (DUF1289 family)
VGCGRHIDDIVGWSRMAARERHEANLRAELRRAQRQEASS